MGLEKKDYYDYIRSDKWKHIRESYYNSNMYKTLKKKNNGWICYCCTAKNKPLDLHHRTYKRLGEENISVDLVPVCRECHNEIHIAFRSENISLWEATKKIKKIKRRKIKKT